MTEMVSSAFRALAASARSQDNNQTTTTMGKIIRLQARTSGVRIPLKKARGTLKELSDEGYIDFGPAPPGKVMLSPFNRPIVVSMTEKGLRFYSDLEKQDEIKESLRAKIDLLPGPVIDRPGDVPMCSLRSMSLRHQDMTVLDVISRACQFFKKNYCFLSRQEILKRLSEWHHIDMALRTLNRCLKRLYEAGWIRRFERSNRQTDGTFKGSSSVTELCGKFWAWAKSMASRLSKLFARTGGPQMAHHSTLPKKRGISDGSSTGASPSGLRDKGAPSATRFTDEDRQANILRLGRLVATVFKN